MSKVLLKLLQKLTGRGTESHNKKLKQSVKCTLLFSFTAGLYPFLTIFLNLCLNYCPYRFGCYNEITRKRKGKNI